MVFPASEPGITLPADCTSSAHMRSATWGVTGNMDLRGVN